MSCNLLSHQFGVLGASYVFSFLFAYRLAPSSVTKVGWPPSPPYEMGFWGGRKGISAAIKSSKIFPVNPNHGDTVDQITPGHVSALWLKLGSEVALETCEMFLITFWFVISVIRKLQSQRHRILTHVRPLVWNVTFRRAFEWRRGVKTRSNPSRGQHVVVSHRSQDQSTWMKSIPTTQFPFPYFCTGFPSFFHCLLKTTALNSWVYIPFSLWVGC